MNSTSPRLAEHLVMLAEPWSAWRWVLIRGAGFPFDLLERIAGPAAAEARDTALREEEAFLEACNRLADAMVERHRSDPRSARKSLRAFLRVLRRGELPPAIPNDDGSFFDEMKELRTRSESVRALQAAASRAFRGAEEHVEEELRTIAQLPLFREALLWQNRRVLELGIDRLLRDGSSKRDHPVRVRERKVAMYLQRYCAKNDTIGFFGPFAWARLDPGKAQSFVAAGPSLLARRIVQFEHWGLEVLANQASQDARWRQALRPRRAPATWVENGALHRFSAEVVPMSEADAALLLLCDGERSAGECWGLAVSRGIFPTAEMARQAMERLAASRALLWTIELPNYELDAERALRAEIERLFGADPPPEILGPIKELGDRRTAVERSSGNPDALRAALSELDAAFERITHQSAARRAGEMYASRTLVYESCTRDIHVALGEEFVRKLGTPLALLLKSCRWYTYTLATRMRRALLDAHRTIAASTGKPLRLSQLWPEVSRRLSAGAEPLARPVIDEMHARWAKILRLIPGVRRAGFSSAELASEVEAAFHAPHPGWPSARHHSPDIMIAAQGGPEGLREGRYELVLGEMHVAASTMASPCVTELHPHSDELVRALESDFPSPRVQIVAPSTFFAGHVHDFSLSSLDIDLEIGETRSRRPREQVLAPGSLFVEDAGDTLRVLDPEKRYAFDVIEFLDHFLGRESLYGSRILMPADLEHCPRIRIDDLVVVRESWRLSPEQTEWAAKASSSESRFMQASRLAQQLGLPRRIFVRIPEEQKPFYIDLTSPILIDLFASLSQKASAIAISEMLPGPSEAWLSDAQGRLYMSEVRMIAVDPNPWRPPEASCSASASECGACRIESR